MNTEFFHKQEISAFYDFWKRLLLNNPVVAQKSYDFSRMYCEKNNCFFNNKVLDTYLAFEFITNREKHVLNYLLPSLINAIERLIPEILTSSEFIKKFNVPNEIMPLLEASQNLDGIIKFARFDGILLPENLKIIEFNADSPAGAGYLDIVEESIIKSPIYKLFKEKYILRTSQRRKSVLNTLIRTYENWSHAKLSKKPVIAIIDDENTTTKPEFEILLSYFNQANYQAMFARDEELEIKNNQAFAAGRPIDIIYRRILLTKLVKSKSVEIFRQISQKNLACIVNPFVSWLGSSKTMIEILTDPQYQEFWSKKERHAINQLLPWTHRVCDDFVVFNGCKINLPDFILQNKNMLVMKPSNSFGGDKIIIGNDTNKNSWENFIEQAIKENSWVVQEFVEIPKVAVPDFNPKMKFIQLYSNFSPFVFDAKYCGAMGKLSTSKIINVSSGASVIPVVSLKS